jgi:hypothetical protein
MRRITALALLSAFALVAFAAPAMAAQTEKGMGAVPPWYKPEPITLTGKVVFSRIEVPHYELWVDRPMLVPPPPGSKIKPSALPDPVYVLAGPFNFKTYEGKTVQIIGYVFKGPNIYMRGPVLLVTKIWPAFPLRTME